MATAAAVVVCKYTLVEEEEEEKEEDFARLRASLSVYEESNEEEGKNGHR